MGAVSTGSACVYDSKPFLSMAGLIVSQDVLLFHRHSNLPSDHERVRRLARSSHPWHLPVRPSRSLSPLDPTKLRILRSFVLGLAISPLFLGPLSEVFGRRPIYLLSLTLFLIWNIPVATAQNITTILVARFFCGMSGSAFLSVAGGTVADLFHGLDVGAVRQSRFGLKRSCSRILWV